LNGLTIAIEPATTAVMKHAAPISSPIAREPESAFMAANVLKTSGEPFPNARKVTPAMLSDIPRMLAIVERLTQKKSLAAIPIVENRIPSHDAKIRNGTPRAFPKRQ
jgi:hypothetical protein